jgi:hypothetical protein
VIVVHLTLALVRPFLPFQIKLCIKALGWVLIVNVGFQHVAVYHILAKKTWLTTKIHLAVDNLLAVQLINLPLMVLISLSKLAWVGRWWSTKIPRY